MTIVASTIGTNSSRDYAWLLSSVANWLHRADLASLLPDFVMLAEKRINGDLKARLQNLTVALSASSGVASVTLPSDLNDIRLLSLDGIGKLDYLTPAAFTRRYQAAAPGQPLHYTIAGGVLTLGPTPDIDYSLTLNYNGAVPALADVGGSNWLIQQHAEIYLAATMCEALMYIKDTTALRVWEPKYQAGVDNLNETDWNVAGPMAVRADTNTP